MDAIRNYFETAKLSLEVRKLRRDLLAQEADKEQRLTSEQKKVDPKIKTIFRRQ